MTMTLKVIESYFPLSPPIDHLRYTFRLTWKVVRKFNDLQDVDEIMKDNERCITALCLHECYDPST